MDDSVRKHQHHTTDFTEFAIVTVPARQASPASLAFSKLNLMKCKRPNIQVLKTVSTI